MRVWVTRSQPGADRQALALAEHGHSPVVAPVITISRLSVAVPRGIFSHIIFLSEHAVRFGVDELQAARVDLDSTSVYAVGPGTAARLAEQGIAARVAAIASSEGILALPEFAELADAEILIVAGVGGRKVLAAGLLDRGARVEQLRVYERQPVAGVAADLSDVEAIAVASGDGFEFMARVWFAADGRGDVPVFVPSERVAAVGGELGFSRVYTCAGAGVEALVDGLTAFATNG
jgi:uroporphyrinogen-III synthase